MTRVILDQATLARLQGFEDRVEVCDESGRVIGFFSPLAQSAVSSGCSGQGLKIPFNEQQLDRFEQEAGGRSLNEVIADLKARP